MNSAPVRYRAARPAAPTRLAGLEVRGVGPVPPAERTSRPREFVWIWHSAQFSLGTVVLGSVPIVFGLGWWAAATAVLVGLLLGTAVFAPLVRMGMRTGANDPISSGAHFGVRGRVLANAITIVVAVGFFSIAVWTGTTAILVAAERVLGTPVDSTALAVVMPVVAAVVALLAVYGRRILLATYKATAVIGALVLATLVVVLLPDFDPGLPGGSYVLGDFASTWLLAASFAATFPLSYVTFQGDYSRYLSPVVSDRSAVLWNGAAMYGSSAAAFLVGAYVTTQFSDPSVTWVAGTVEVVPRWFAVVVILFGFVGTLPQASLCLYAAGLSANSVWWRGSRPVATAAVAGLGVVALHLGAVVYDAVDSISAFVLTVLVLVAPWAAIVTVGHALRRGRYEVAALYDFVPPGWRGRYWYTGGFDLRAFGAFVPAVLLGLSFVDNPVYSGPLAGLAGGVDLSCVVSFAGAAVVYYLLCRLFPAAGGEVADGP